MAISFSINFAIGIGNTKHPVPILDLLMDMSFNQLEFQSMEMMAVTMVDGAVAVAVAVVAAAAVAVTL